MEQNDIGLFALARRRMDWISQRQGVLARNIANASTPGYRPSDLPDFGKTLKQTSGVPTARTAAAHLSGSDPGRYRPVQQKGGAYGPDGNAVAVDAQLAKIADTETAQSTATTIYRKYMGLFGMALGRNP